MRKTGVSAASMGEKGKPFEINEELFKKYRENKIEAMEVSLPFGYDFFKLDFDFLKRASEEYGVELWSYHLPFCDDFDPSALEADRRQKMFDSFKRFMDMAAVADVKKIVVHPSSEPIETDKETRKRRMETAKESLSILADYCAAYGQELAVEDLPRTCLGNSGEEMYELLSSNSKIKICYDVNHIPHDEHSKFVDMIGDRIVTVHISDYIIEDNHLPPFDGKLDWKMLIGLLNKINYSGPFMYETSLTRKDGTRFSPDTYRKMHEQIENL